MGSGLHGENELNPPTVNIYSASSGIQVRASTPKCNFGGEDEEDLQTVY